ncbi:unnamed protein product [marine sediment metagenome]|uniref:Peptidase M15A C-terminal domain-containing protein n=1 Tax=marine sediment metagenome TaxID=412755 RepID=X0UVA0_9ZZZZ
MIKLKESVKLHCLTPQALMGMMVLRDVFAKESEPFTITSVSDSNHGRKSLHQHGRAFDVRTYNVMNATLMSTRSAAALGRDWDVVLESDHIHVEWDPKG